MQVLCLLNARSPKPGDSVPTQPSHAREPSPISSEPTCEEQAAPSSPGEPPAEQALPETLQCTGYEWDEERFLWLLIQPADADKPPLRIREAQVHHDRPRWLLQHWRNNERPVNPQEPELYEPLRIVREGTRGGKPGFWVQYVGFDASRKNLGWLSEEDVVQCAPGLLGEYRAQTNVGETKRKRTGGQVGASRRRTPRETGTADNGRSTRRRSGRLTGS